jgi:hypothetical protein
MLPICKPSCQWLPVCCPGMPLCVLLFLLEACVVLLL